MSKGRGIITLKTKTRRYRRFPVKVMVGITSERIDSTRNITEYPWKFIGTGGKSVRIVLNRSPGWGSKPDHATKHCNNSLRDYVLIRRAPKTVEDAQGKILFVVTNVSNKHQTKVLRRYLRIVLRQFESVTYDGNYLSFSSLSDQTLFNLKYV